MGNLQGKTAFTTGASRGIGAAIAQSLARSGVHLGLASRSGDDLGIDGCMAMKTDVRDPASLEELATATANRFGGIDILDHELRERDVRCSTVAPGGVATDFAMGRGRYEGMPELAGMMSPEDVAEAVLYVLSRPRNHRILEVAFRPMTEGSMG